MFFVDSSSGGANSYPDGSELFLVGNYAKDVMGYSYPAVPQSTEEFAAAGLANKVPPADQSDTGLAIRPQNGAAHRIFLS